MIPARWAVTAPPDPRLTAALASDLHIPETLAGKREQIVTERERASAERERATAAVGASLLALYERIRRGKAPLALYPLHGDACGHCFTAVPTQRRVLIQRGASIEACEACGVLLYAPE